MGSYCNAYDILSDVRRGLNEYSTTKVQGTDTSGAYTNTQLVNMINAAQRFIYSFLLTRIPENFLTSTTITGVDSVFALPWDFGRLLIFKDDDNRKIYPIKIDRLKVGDSTGNKRLYYRKGNDLIIDRDSITDTYTLWYYKKCRELDQGKAAGDDTLASTAKAIADYYNDMDIEDITGDQYAEVTDYTAARVITSTITLAKDSYYGFISELPEPFHFLIAERAIMKTKGVFPATQEPPKISEVNFFMEQLRETLRAYAGSKLDISMEEIWLDFEPTVPTRLGIVSSES